MDMEIFFPDGKKVNALYNGLTIKTDQFRNSGGEGSAPSPFDLFLSSIGTCAGFYVLGFCSERNIPTDEIKLLLRAERNSETGMLIKIALEIQLPSEFPEKYKKAMVRAADLRDQEAHLRSPGHWHLH